jgi:hypothetical protein
MAVRVPAAILILNILFQPRVVTDFHRLSHKIIIYHDD